MSLPIGEVGVGAISGGTLVALAIKLLPILLRKFNNKNRNNINSVKPGKANVCIERGKEILQHDIAIKHLCALTEKVDERMEVARKENREDHQIIINRLNELQKLK